MRLAQLARKVDRKQEEIVRFLEGKFKIKLDKDPNLKLDDEQVNAALEEFEIVAEIVEAEENIEVPTVPEKNILDVLNEESKKAKIESSLETETKAKALDSEEIHATVSDAEKITANVSEEIIVDENAIDFESDTESELDPFIERKVDPNAELIKAPVIKLDGPKVLGKIDLPDTKKPVDEASTNDNVSGVLAESKLGESLVQENESDVMDHLEASMQAANQDIKEGKLATSEEVEENVEEEEEFSIYKDNKGIYHFSEEQKQNRANFFEEKKTRKEAERLKKKKAEHYKKIVAAKESKAPKKTVKTISEQVSKPVSQKEGKMKKVEKEKPTTLWGRFLYWLND